MELITDRTQADVLSHTAKGFYNHTDLNRVESAVATLCDLARQLDIHLALTTKTDWAVPGPYSPDTWPTAAQMKRYLGNVRALCQALSLAVSLPDSMAWLTWEKANDIEAALFCAKKRIQGVLQTYQYSGELIAGEENTL